MAVYRSGFPSSNCFYWRGVSCSFVNVSWPPSPKLACETFFRCLSYEVWSKILEVLFSGDHRAAYLLKSFL